MELGCASEDAQSAANAMQERRQAAAKRLGTELHSVLFYGACVEGSSTQAGGLLHALRPGKSLPLIHSAGCTRVGLIASWATGPGCAVTGPTGPLTMRNVESSGFTSCRLRLALQNPGIRWTM